MSVLRWLPCCWLVVACTRGPAPADEVVTPAAAPVDANATHDEDATEAPMRLVEVAPGIFAALQPAALRFADANGALVVTDEGLVVIDGPQRLVAAQWMLEQADAKAKAKAKSSAPRRVLITTHWHVDHSLAAAWAGQVLEPRGDAFERWGHAGLSALLATEGRQQLQERRQTLPGLIERGTTMQTEGRHPDGTPLTPDERVELDGELAELHAEVDALEGITLQPPTHPVSEPTTLALGSLTLELIPLRAHTEADLVIHIPEAGVLVTGDVLDEIPFAGHGRPRRWLAALQRLRALDPTTIIPGHGPVLGPEHLDTLIELWEALLAQAMIAIQHGEGPAQRYAEWEATPEHRALREALCTDPLSERAFARFVPEALARTMADLRGDLDPAPGAG